MGAGLERKYYVFALRAFSDVTATIVLPAAVVLVLKHVAHVNGIAFYALLTIAFIGTAITLWRKMKMYGAAYEQLNQASDRNGSTRS